MFGVNDAISKREEWKMQGKRMHGDRGRYLVNVGEKCNLMIPWTKVQILSLLICFEPHTSHCSTILSTFGINGFFFKMSIEMSSKQAK